MRLRHSLRGLAAACLSVVALHAAPVAAAANDGTVSGQVVNRSAGGSATAGTGVVLVAFGRKEQAPLGQQTTQAAADGQYSFTGLDRDPNIVYITLARFGEVNYPADQPFTLVENPLGQADIGVYDSTISDDALQFDRLNLLLVGAQDGVMQFMQMGSLINTGDRTYITPNPQDGALARAVKFALPPGALGAQMQSGFNNQDIISGVGGIQISSPIVPGRHDFALSFQIPSSGRMADLTLQMPYATGTYNVYLPDAGYNLETGALAAGGQAQLGGQSYTLYSASNLAKQTIVSASMTMSNGPGSGLIEPTHLAAISLGVVLFVLGGGVLLFGTRRGPRQSIAAARSASESDSERLELVVRLAALDERYAAGQMEQSEYERERERGKDRLRRLMHVRRQATPTGA